MHYRGTKVSLGGRSAREGSPIFRSPVRQTRTYGLRIPRGSTSSKSFFSIFKRGQKPSEGRNTQGFGVIREASVSYGYYRPGANPQTGREGLSGQKKWNFPTGSWAGVKGILKGAALLGMIGLAAWGKNRVLGLLQDAAGFKLAKVTVEGNRFLRSEDLLKAVDLPMGENMFKLDLEGAAGRLEKLDWVEKAFLERRLPQTVLISVRERKIVALLDSGALYGVTGEGRVLSANEELAKMDLPLLSGVRVPPEALGTTILASALQPGLDFLAFAGNQSGDWIQEVSEVNLSDPQDLKVTFIDGITATFNAQVTAVELRRLDLVRGDLARKGLRAGTMDFRYKDTVLVKAAGKGA